MGKKKIDIKTLIESKLLTIKDLVLYIKSKIIFVFIIMLVFAILGFMKGVSVTDEYVSSSQLLPEYSSPVSNNLFNLGGINANPMRQVGGTPSAAIPVELYPRIVLSDNFLHDLIEREYFFTDGGQYVSLQDYFYSYYEEDVLGKARKSVSQYIAKFKQKKQGSTSIGESDVIDSLLNAESDTLINHITVLDFNAKERKAISSLRDRITITRTDQLFELRTRMPDPNVAALLNRDIVEKLMNFVGDRQMERESTNFTFLSDQRKDAEARYKKAEASLASYRDHNRGLVSNQARGVEIRLNNEYELAYTLYNQLAQQVESARVKLEEARPIITVLQNPMVPNTKINSGPIGVTIIFAIAGAFIAFAIISIRLFLYFVNSWLNE